MVVVSGAAPLYRAYQARALLLDDTTIKWSSVKDLHLRSPKADGLRPPRIAALATLDKRIAQTC